jgi:hypothetical protein
MYEQSSYCDLVETAAAATAAVIERVALLRGAGEGLVGGGRARVEDRVGLFVAVLTGLALEPVDVAARVEHHVEGLGGLSHADTREVLAAALARPGHDRSGEVLWQDLDLQGLKIRLLDAAERELELGSERVDSGRLAL